MMDRLSAEVAAITSVARSSSSKVRDKIAEKIFLNRSYRRTFLDSQGDLTPHGRAVLQDLVKESGIGLASPSFDLAELAAKEGRRRMVLHIFSRFKLPQRRIENLERQLTQEDED